MDKTILTVPALQWLIMFIAFAVYLINEWIKEAKKAKAEKSVWNLGIWFSSASNRLLFIGSLLMAIGLQITLFSYLTGEVDPNDPLSLQLLRKALPIVSLAVGYMPTSMWNKLTKTVAHQQNINKQS